MIEFLWDISVVPAVAGLAFFAGYLRGKGLGEERKQ